MAQLTRASGVMVSPPILECLLILTEMFIQAPGPRTRCMALVLFSTLMVQSMSVNGSSADGTVLATRNGETVPSIRAIM